MWFVCCRDEINAFYCFMNIVHDFMLSLDTKNVVIGLIAQTKPHVYFSGKRGDLATTNEYNRNEMERIYNFGDDVACSI